MKKSPPHKTLFSCRVQSQTLCPYSPAFRHIRDKMPWPLGHLPRKQALAENGRATFLLPTTWICLLNQGSEPLLRVLGAL